MTAAVYAYTMPNVSPQRRLRQLLDSSGLTHEGMADVMGVTRVSVTRWVNGSPMPGPVQRWLELVESIQVTGGRVVVRFKPID